MSLQDTLKLIQGVADKYMIDKPYIVGGLPRDIYMDIPDVKTTDIDLTTNSPEVLRLGILLAEELNVTFDLSDDGHVTVFSEDFDLDFSSHFISPNVIEYLDGDNKGLEEAFSRDFTINTLHQDLITREITDPTGKGFEDIKNRVIKTPVPADITLTDDPRRVYRAINLAARYDFDIAQDVKDFTLDNPELFSSENVKDKYMAVKIGKALKSNEELTLKLLKELNLFRNVPLSGHFKDVLIKRKILADYLGSVALNPKLAFQANSWSAYANQGLEYKELADWWKANASNVDGNWNPSYQSWTSWYNKHKSGWGNIHKGPKETLDIMKSEVNSGFGVSSLIPTSLMNGLKQRKQDLYNLLGYDEEIPKEERTPQRAQSYNPLLGGKVYTKPGVNIDNVTPAVSSFIESIGNKAQELGAQTPIITSGWRSLDNQSSLVGRNWKSNGGISGGRRYLENLYGREYGGQMSSIFEQYGTGPQAQALVVKVIKSRSVGSYHITNPGQALDLSMTSGIKEVLDSIQSEGLFDMKIVDETNSAGPHYHVSIKGENFRLASIRDRKERLKKLSNY